MPRACDSRRAKEQVPEGSFVFDKYQVVMTFSVHSSLTPSATTADRGKMATSLPLSAKSRVFCLWGLPGSLNLVILSPAALIRERRSPQALLWYNPWSFIGIVASSCVVQDLFAYSRSAQPHRFFDDAYWFSATCTPMFSCISTSLRSLVCKTHRESQFHI